MGNTEFFHGMESLNCIKVLHDYSGTTERQGRRDVSVRRGMIQR